MAATDRIASRNPESIEARRRKQEHSRRCSGLPPLKPGEAERLIAEYTAKWGGFTKCPAVYLVAQS
jgi:hypothetical protein